MRAYYIHDGILFQKKATLSDAKKMCDKKDMGVMSLEKIAESDAVADVLSELGNISNGFGLKRVRKSVLKKDYPQMLF